MADCAQLQLAERAQHQTRSGTATFLTASQILSYDDGFGHKAGITIGDVEANSITRSSTSRSGLAEAMRAQIGQKVKWGPAVFP